MTASPARNLREASNPWGDESSVVHSPTQAKFKLPLEATNTGRDADTEDSLLAEAEAALLRSEKPSARRLPRVKNSRHPPGSAMAALDEAEEPGVYFREPRRDGRRADEQEDPELQKAIEETIRLLFGVPGIHRVGPGMNEQGEKVVLIHVKSGFHEASMRQIPAKVHRFATLLALPYDLLPLRRERIGG